MSRRSGKFLEVKVTLRPTISRPARHGVRRPSGTRDQIFFLKVKVKVTLRPTVSRSVRLGVRRPSGTATNFAISLRFSFRQLLFVMSELELEFFLRPTVSRPVSLGIGPPFGTLDQILACSSSFCLTVTLF
jgi:hypothetical protein